MWKSLLLASAFILMGDQPRESAPIPKGHLVIIGGGIIPPELRQKALELAGGTKAHIVIVPTASMDIEAASREVMTRFRDFGASEFEVIDLNKTDESVSAILRADLIWFTGGDQNRLTKLMANTPLPDAIRRRYLEGATIVGTSAGAAVMADLMMTGTGDLDTIRNGTTQVIDGLGLMDDVIIDQHFLKRGRFNRLAGAVLDHPEMLGIGIDEGTALVVSGRQFEVAGRSNVIVVDARASAKSGSAKAAPGVPAAGVNMSLHVLKAGMKYHMDKGIVPPIETAQGGGQ
jgi:cyanophycinase